MARRKGQKKKKKKLKKKKKKTPPPSSGQIWNYPQKLFSLIITTFSLIRYHIPERFTLVKLEGYCRVYGPRTVYCFPWVSSPVAIG
jgi:hypothetical protein